MKKIFALLLTLALCLSLAACGGAPAAEDPADDAQAAADADFNQMMSYAQELSNQSDAIADWSAGMKDGSISAEDGVEQYGGITEECAAISAELSEASWQTDIYSAEIQMLADAAEALAAGSDMTYNGLMENDASAMDESTEYFTAYKEQIAAFMDAVDQYQ